VEIRKGQKKYNIAKYFAIKKTKEVGANNLGTGTWIKGAHPGHTQETQATNYRGYNKARQAGKLTSCEHVILPSCFQHLIKVLFKQQVLTENICPSSQNLKESDPYTFFLEKKDFEKA